MKRTLVRNFILNGEDFSINEELPYLWLANCNDVSVEIDLYEVNHFALDDLAGQKYPWNYSDWYGGA